MDSQDRSERGSGRTYRMVMDIPKAGGIVVTHSMGTAHYIREMIRDVRGVTMSTKIDVVVIEEPADVRTKLQGQRRPIFIDHACYDGSADLTHNQRYAITLAQNVARFITERCRGR